MQIMIVITVITIFLSIIQCQAQNAAERSPRSASMHMEVKYAPKVTITLNQDKIVELQSIQLSCHANANPPNVVYKWYINNEIAYGDYSTQLTIATTSRDLNGAVVKCEVSNAVGKSEDTQTLDVYCKLLFPHTKITIRYWIDLKLIIW